MRGKTLSFYFWISSLIGFFVLGPFLVSAPSAMAEGAIQKGENYIYGVTRSSNANNYIISHKIGANDKITKELQLITKVNGTAASFVDINGLAVREDGFYIKSNQGTTMGHINWNGVLDDTWNASELVNTARSGAFLPDKTTYITTTDKASGTKKMSLYFYDIDKRVLLSTKDLINTTSTPSSELHQIGDIAAGDDGYVYVVCSDARSLNTKVLKINYSTAEIVSILPIPGLTHSPAVAFMEDGRLLVSDENNKGAIADFALGSITTKDKEGVPLPGMGGVTTNVTDFASLNFPNFTPNLSIFKEAPVTAEFGGIYEYKLTIKNTGTIMSLGNFLTDKLSDYLEYVPNSTTLNGIVVSDKEKTSPLFSVQGLPIYSQNSMAILKNADVIVTFKVKVKDQVDKTKEIRIPNTAKNLNTTGEIGVNVESNEVITIVSASEFPVDISIKQEVIDPVDDVVIPNIGYSSLSSGTNEKYNFSIPSYIADTNSPFKKIKLPSKNSEEIFKVICSIPEFYSYIGYQLTLENIQHNSIDMKMVPIEQIDFAKSSNYWLTIYIKPNVKEPPFYNWSTKVNDFGMIGNFSENIPPKLQK